MRALLLRRIGLIEAGAGGPVLIGPAVSPGLVRLQGFLARNASPHRVLDPADDPEAAALLERYASRPTDLPLVVCPDGSLLANPTEADLARALGMLRVDAPDRTYDVAIVGAGPAGLKHGSLRRIRGPVRDRLRCPRVRGPGRSERPHRELPRVPRGHLRPGAHRPRLRASAEVRGRDRDSEPGRPTGLLSRADDGRAGRWPRRAGKDDRRRLRGPLPPAPHPERRSLRRPGRLVLGLARRGPALPAATGGTGRGWQFRRPGRRVSVRGSPRKSGCSSATRAPDDHVAVPRRPHRGERQHRGPDPDRGRRSGGWPGSHLERVRWRQATGRETELPIRNVFLFVGVEPATGWLRDCGVALDAEGFVRTGSRGPGGRPLALESNVPGVFAVGDVRAGSVKRVGGAIGEGAAVVPQLHTVLAEADRRAGTIGQDRSPHQA